MYEMKEEYRTGIESIDSYYERLFNIIDKAYEVLDSTSEKKYEKIIHEVDNLKKEIKKYFEEQERYLVSIGYAGLEEQKIENKEFYDKLEKTNIEDIMKRGSQYVVNILQYFSDWLVEHILNIEKKVAI